jgi:hypothetical protein
MKRGKVRILRWRQVIAIFALGLTPGWLSMVRPAQAMPPAQASALGAHLVATAQKMLGMPYVWGGQGKEGFDCSGFIGWVFGQNGYVLPRVSRQQALVGQAVALGALQAGDLLFFSEQPQSERITHVAMSLGGDRFIHAALGRGQVAYDALTEHYYAARFKGARRPLALPPGRYATGQGLAPVNLIGKTMADMQAVAQNMQRHPGLTQVEKNPQDIPTDMLVEHADARIPAQLILISGRENSLAGAYDGFEPASWSRDETGLGVRVGVTRTPQATSGFGLAQGSFFSPTWGLRVAARMPVVLPLWGPKPEGNLAFVRWRTARDYGRILNGASLGVPGAKVYAALDRSAVLNLGMGLLMRHFVPNAASSTVDDLLALPNALSATLEVRLASLQLRAVMDDVMAPQTMGTSVQWRPTMRENKEHFALSLAWAADIHAPYAGRAAGVHGLELGAHVLAYDGDNIQWRPYLTLAGLIADIPTPPLRVGAALGSTWALYQGHMGGAAHNLTLRAEARVAQSGFAPSYFGLGYHAARQAAFGQGDLNPSARGPSKLDVLMAQRGGQVHVTGLGEIQYALARRLQVGARYEDGGGIGAKTGKPPAPADRTLSTYVGLNNLPLGSSGMVLHVHGLWHAEAAKMPWPGVRAQASHAYTQLTGRWDITRWLDLTASVVHPLGVVPPGQHAWVSLVGIAAHGAL